MRGCPMCATTSSTLLWRDGEYDLVRCARCRLAYVANPPSAEALSRLYSFASGYHENFADDAAEIARRERKARDQTQELLAAGFGGGKLLDVGASAGYFVKAAKDRGWDAEGIELSPDTARLAAERYGVRVREGRLADVTERGWDAITMWDVIEHVEQPREELARAAALVRPGGLLAIMTPNLDGLYPRVSFRLRHIVGQWNAVNPPYHLTQFSVATLRHMLEATGWEVHDTRHGPQSFVYNFGTLRMQRNPRRLLYTLLLAPLQRFGPRVRAGDEITVFARRIAERPAP